MITPQEADKLTEREAQEVSGLEAKIDRQISRVFELATSPITELDVYAHEEAVPVKLVRELIRRYSSHWNVGYVSPKHNGYGHISKGYFTFAKRKGK